MSEGKHDAFLRLVGKRFDAVADAIRIFGNLSGPSYEWTPAEILEWFGKIDATIVEALTRFKETKRWRDQAPADVPVQEHEPDSAPPIEPDVPEREPEFERDPRTKDHAYFEKKEARRQENINRILSDPDNDYQTICHQLVLAHEVIEGLQARLDEARGDTSGSRQH